MNPGLKARCTDEGSSFSPSVRIRVWGAKRRRSRACPITKTLENGTTAVYDYDNASRLTAITHSNTGGAFQTVSYTLNAVGNRTARTQNTVTDTYTFDPTDQITDVSYAGGLSASYSYDAAGNRTGVSGAVPGAGSYTTNLLNQYTAALSQTMTHDARGNLTQLGTGGTFTYDSKNRLLTATVNSNTMTVAYDYRNRPVSRTINGTTTYLIHDGWNLIEELDDTGDLEVAYIHGPMIDELLAKIDTTGTVYYHHDGLGSTIALTDDTGDPVENYTYDVFGTVTILDPSTLASRPLTACGNHFLFTGREWIAEVALYDYRNRIYNAELGRFLQTDPIRFDAGDVNLYRYVGNDPVSFTDPEGLEMTRGECHSACFKAFLLCRVQCFAVCAAAGPAYLCCLKPCLGVCTVAQIGCQIACQIGGSPWERTDGPRELGRHGGGSGTPSF